MACASQDGYITILVLKGGNLVPGNLKLGLQNHENIGRGRQVTGNSGQIQRKKKTNQSPRACGNTPRRQH